MAWKAMSALCMWVCEYEYSFNDKISRKQINNSKISFERRSIHFNHHNFFNEILNELMCPKTERWNDFSRYKLFYDNLNKKRVCVFLCVCWIIYKRDSHIPHAFGLLIIWTSMWRWLNLFPLYFFWVSTLYLSHRHTQFTTSNQSQIITIFMLKMGKTNNYHFSFPINH